MIVEASEDSKFKILRSIIRQRKIAIILVLPAAGLIA